jgi:putative transposase
MRPKRVQFAGACYFITLQGNNRQDIFQSNQDRRYFLSLLRAYKDRYGLKVYAYCLMGNEALLLLETAQANLSLVMQGFNTTYTKYFNAGHGASGHVFQGRYKALLVEKEAFLAEVTRYIHLHPARAGLKERPWRYQWSSCSAYVASHEDELLVDSEPVLSQLGKVRLKQSVRYLHFIKERMRSVSDLILPIVGGTAIGTKTFLAKCQAKGETSEPRSGSPAEARRVIAEMAARHGLDEEKLLGRAQWREITAVRRQAIYRLWKELGMGVTEIGRLFNRTPSAISQLIKAMHA